MFPKTMVERHIECLEMKLLFTHSEAYFRLYILMFPRILTNQIYKENRYLSAYLAKVVCDIHVLCTFNFGTPTLITVFLFICKTAFVQNNGMGN